MLLPTIRPNLQNMDVRSANTMIDVMELERTASQIVHAAVQVHRSAGPGMLESAYEAMLAYELRDRGLQVQQQTYIHLDYRTLHIERAFCIDLIVNDAVVVEVKSVESVAPVHLKQVVTYLRMTGLRLGFLLNFGQNTLKAGGIHRIANNAPRR